MSAELSAVPIPMPRQITIGDKYGPAMLVSDQARADAYFEECVSHTMSFWKSREEAEKIEKANLGYFAGYHSRETRERVERLFRCAHPVFGTVAQTPSQEEILNLGITMGQKAPK